MRAELGLTQPCVGSTLHVGFDSGFELRGSSARGVTPKLTKTEIGRVIPIKKTLGAWLRLLRVKEGFYPARFRWLASAVAGGRSGPVFGIHVGSMTRASKSNGKMASWAIPMVRIRRPKDGGR